MMARGDGGEVLAEALGVGGFRLEVHLVVDHPRELAHDGGEVADEVVVAEERAGRGKQQGHDAQVGGDEFLHPGPQHLDRHLDPLVARPVDLAEAGGGNGNGVEIVEDRLHRPFELAFDDRADVLDRERGAPGLGVS